MKKKNGRKEKGGQKGRERQKSCMALLSYLTNCRSRPPLFSRYICVYPFNYSICGRILLLYSFILWTSFSSPVTMCVCTSLARIKLTFPTCPSSSPSPFYFLPFRPFVSPFCARRSTFNVRNLLVFSSSSFSLMWFSPT